MLSCAKKKTDESYVAPKPSGKSGAELAQIYCASCHQFPEPSLLPKNIWKNGILPNVTSVKFNPSTKETYIAWRGNNSFIKKYDSNFSVTDSIPVKSPVSDILFKNKSLNVLTLGIMDPNDLSQGSLVNINSKKSSQIVLDKLTRPVQMSYGDLNQDNLEDILICNFGNEMGNLTWYEGGNMKPHLLKSMPGAR